MLTHDQIKRLITCVDYSIRHITQYHTQSAEPQSSQWCSESVKPLEEVLDVLRVMRKETKPNSKGTK